MGALRVLLAIVVGVPVLVVLVSVAAYFNLWLRSKASGVRVGIPDMVMMRLRRVPASTIVEALITLEKSGIEIPVETLEAFYLAGGNLWAVTDAAIAADKADLNIGFDRMAAIDLAGRDVADAVNTSVNPKVLLCPPENSGKRGITGVCQDGIRLAVQARVTVRTHLDRVVGGAGADTVVARVGEGIVAAIGRAKTHKDILQSPEAVAAYLLEHGLDSGTCFEIISVDVADVEVLDNVGATLRSARAETDKRIAQAKAEVRRAAAVAAHREMVSRTTEMESRVRAASSVLPLAAAAAVREYNLGSRHPVPAVTDDRVRWR